MYCPHCGNHLPDGARFCSRCGNDVSGDLPTQRIPRPEPRNPMPDTGASGSGGRTTKIILIVAILAVIAVIVVAGSIVIRNNVTTQRAARDAQQALAEAEEKSSMFADTDAKEQESDDTPADDGDSDDEDKLPAASAEDKDEDEIEEEEGVEDDPVAQDGEAPRHSEAYTDFRDRLDDLQAEADEPIPGNNTGEMVQNSSDLYKRCDNLLNEIYQHIKANMDSDSFAILREDEREWIKERDAKAEADAADWEGGSGYAPIYNGSLIGSTLDRCEYLMGYVQ